MHGGQIEGHHEVALIEAVGIQQVGVAFAFARGGEQQVIDLVLVFQRQAGFGHRHAIGRAFHSDAILAGKVERVLGKIPLIAFVVEQHRPKQAGRTTTEDIVDVHLGLSRRQLVIVAAHPTEGEDHGIGHTGLFHLFFHVLQNVFEGHAVKHPHEAFVDHHLKGHLVGRDGGLVLSGHEGKLDTVEFDVEFHFGVGRHVLIDLGEIAGHGTDIELVFTRAIHHGLVALDTTLVVLLVLGAIPSPLVHLARHISVPPLAFQFAAFVPRVGLQQGAKVFTIVQVHARQRLSLGVVDLDTHLADAAVAEIIDGSHDELGGIVVIGGGFGGGHYKFHAQMELHFARTKGKGPVVDAELHWGGRVRQGFDVLELPLVLGGIDLVLGSVIVLTLVGLQTQRLQRWFPRPAASLPPCLAP